MGGNWVTPIGRYVIWGEKEDKGLYSVYSTDNIFWRDFFGG